MFIQTLKSHDCMSVCSSVRLPITPKRNGRDLRLIYAELGSPKDGYKHINFSKHCNPTTLTATTGVECASAIRPERPLPFTQR